MGTHNHVPVDESQPLTTRERIVHAARVVFARLGYEATRVEDILVEAAVSRPTFYRVFRNKDEVYAEVSDAEIPPQRSARDRVLEGARETFGRLGFELTRVEDILAASGVSRPTFYRVFSSKQEAYEELDFMAVAYLRRALETTARRQGDYRDFLELVIASYFEWRVGLKLSFDGSGAIAEPPGITRMRKELLREADECHAMRITALIVAIDALASSSPTRDAQASLETRRELALELVVRVLGG